MQTYHSATAELQNHSASKHTSSIKWNEVLSLGGLSVALAISWIAYLEYQPVLLQNFGATHLAAFLVVAKAIILVVVPVMSGWIADRILANRGRFFIVFMIGISTTAMIFMVVASLISSGPDGPLAGLLPVMIVLWLISMSIFIAPAFSMIERFAPGKKLPLVMGVIILITEVIYALEPLVVELVRLFGETLTFIVGGILVLGTGMLFRRLTTDEVLERSSRYRVFKGADSRPYLIITLLGLVLGLGRGFLVEFVPETGGILGLGGKELSFLLLAGSALVAFAMSGWVSRSGPKKILRGSLAVMVLGITVTSIFASTGFLYLAGLMIITISLGVAHLCGLPYVFQRLNPRNTTTGIGFFLGASAVAEGVFEIWYALQH